MNWKKHYEPIKVGDKVKCITPTDSETDTGGAGWEEGLVFTVTKIPFKDCYFGGINGDGVWKGWLIKI